MRQDKYTDEQLTDIEQEHPETEVQKRARKQRGKQEQLPADKPQED